MAKRRVYLGLACTGHETALALVSEEGEVLFAEATERPLQSKRALLAVPDHVLQLRDVLARHAPGDVDVVISKTWSDDAIARFAELEAGAARRIESLARFGGTEVAIGQLRAYRYLLSVGALSIDLAGRTAAAYVREQRGQAHVEVRAYDHHLTHAAAACLTGPFERAACLVVDGLGERGATAAYAFDRGRLSPVSVSGGGRDLPGSLGFFYMDVCSLCGFDPVAGEEWKVMGLAAYGDDDERAYELMKRMIAIDGLAVVRPAGALKAAAELQRMRRSPDAPPMEAAHLARAGQRVFEERMVSLLEALRGRVDADALVLGGGCALNSAFNGRLLERTEYDALHVFCAPADDGNAVGAALLSWREDHPDAAWAPREQSPYLGSELSRATLDALAASGALRVEVPEPQETITRVAGWLDEGKVVGWMQGRAELGPRALGNRSILADARRANMKDRINVSIKRREAFRPFAPAILHEHGDAWFDGYRPSWFMERALRFRNEVRQRVPAVVHEDGTGRLQSVTRERNPRFHALLSAFHERTGVPLVLNTSLNVMGKPIAHTVEDAVGLFVTSDLDVLVLDDHVLTKG